MTDNHGKQIQIQLGTFDIDQLIEALKRREDACNELSQFAWDAVRKISLNPTKKDITLTIMTVRELTGKNKATGQEIYDSIRMRGGFLCPAEVGPQLYLQHKDQPKERNLWIAMEPIMTNDGYLGLFNLGRGGTRYLDAKGGGKPDQIWNGDIQFVFVLTQ